MKAVVIVVSAVVCLFGGTMADDPITVALTGVTRSVLGCKLRALSTPTARVKFQAIRTDGVEYSRVLVPSNRMTLFDVVATSSSAPTFLECVKAAKQNKWDAFSFLNGQCVGYKIGDGICPCTKGDFVLYLASGALRSPSSAKRFTAAKGRAAAAPPPTGYIRKMIYPKLSLTGPNFVSTSATCEAVIADKSIQAPQLLHTVDGKCYYTQSFSPNSCNSCADGPATEVLFKNDSSTKIHLLSKCNGTITPELITYLESTLNVQKPVHIYSHEGYGCIPYPDPASDDKCDIAVNGPAGTVRISVSVNIKNLDLDESSPGRACNGDELFVFPGPVTDEPCHKRATISTNIISRGNLVTIRFQRKPAYNRGSVNKGFAIAVSAHAS